MILGMYKKKKKLKKNVFDTWYSAGQILSVGNYL